MGRHAAPRSWFGRGRTRAVLALGSLLVLGAVGTTAYWTDTVVVTGPSIASGSMDLQVAASTGGTWQAVGTGTNWTGATHIAVSNLTPSESYAFPLAVRNVGQANLTFTATLTRGAAPAWGFVDGAITVQVFRGGTPSADTTYPIQQVCSGGTSLGPAVAPTSGNLNVVTGEALAAGTSQGLCLMVTMVSEATNANQGKSGSLRLDLTATQVTS